MYPERKVKVFKLFVARIPTAMTNQTLFEIFAKFGDVHSAVVSINTLSGESQGCGYVEMEHQGEAQIAIKGLDGSLIEGRNIGVSFAVTKRRS